MGHLGVNLTQHGRYRLFSVHVLIARTFIGERPTSAHIVMHYDDDPTNNHVTNLQYGLPSENSAQMVGRGRQASGERNAKSKLTAPLVREIRCRIAAGEQQNRLATAYGISTSTVCDLNVGRTWRDNMRTEKVGAD